MALDMTNTVHTPTPAEIAECAGNPILAERNALTARVAELEAALRFIIMEAGPRSGLDTDDCGTIATIARRARAVLKAQP